MNVSDVMCSEPRAVRSVERLDAAAAVLWEQDCGFVPVTDGAGVLLGVLTDRDLCMASYTQGKALSELPVTAVMARDLTTCAAADDVKVAMQRMESARVHRLPVVDEGGVLVGVLSCNDLIQACKARPAAVSAKSVLEMLAIVKEPRSGARDFGAAKPAARRRAGAAQAGGAGKAPARKKKAGKAAASKAPAAKRGASKARGKGRA
ncbi:MAG: CBS domain-containing protein [Planctomycetes bacterium]|nr:CBS domain-containing protein [Planctomycetota bacterium]